MSYAEREGPSVPRPPASHPLRRRSVELAGRLASPDDRFAAWANEVGVACGSLAPAETEDMIHERWDYEGRLRATLRHFRRWKP